MAKDYKKAERIWICGSDFEDRPQNKTGLPRVELLRDKETQTQFLGTKVFGKNTFITCRGGKTYGGDAIEVKIIKIG